MERMVKINVMKSIKIVDAHGKGHIFNSSVYFVCALPVDEDTFQRTKLVYESGKGDEKTIFIDGSNVDIWAQIEAQKEEEDIAKT